MADCATGRLKTTGKEALDVLGKHLVAGGEVVTLAESGRRTERNFTTWPGLVLVSPEGVNWPRNAQPEAGAFDGGLESEHLEPLR
jgi:hypothetical protein